MIEKIEGIVINVVKHNESHNVVTLYTHNHGRMAFLVPVGKSKSGRMRNVAFSLMGIIKTDVNIQSQRELHTMHKVEASRLWHGIYSHPLKTSLLFFLAEFCNRLLRQYPADDKMWRFLVDSLERLDKSTNMDLPNFHIVFLLQLLRLTGIEPSVKITDREDRFDMISGETVSPDYIVFQRKAVLLEETETRFLPILLKMNFNNMRKFRFKREEKWRILQRILQYYSIHLSINNEYKSLEVMRDMFS